MLKLHLKFHQCDGRMVSMSVSFNARANKFCFPFLHVCICLHLDLDTEIVLRQLMGRMDLYNLIF